MKSDADLVGRVLKGDKKAFRSLVDKYKQAVYSVILSMTRNETEAQDLNSRIYLPVEVLRLSIWTKNF